VLDEVVIVRDGKFVYRAVPGTKDAEFSFTDQEPVAAESYYYVRAMQRDRNLAWSSPIWVKRAP
jgi:hypothetical protein